MKIEDNKIRVLFLKYEFVVDLYHEFLKVLQISMGKNNEP